MMERRVRGNSHARCETGEKVESGADAPLRPYLSSSWRPRDLIQRKGRIERQGNQNETVHVCRYVTEGTFDAYLWQTVENIKQAKAEDTTMTKAQVNEAIKAAAKAHGFETTEQPGFQGITEIISEELNFTFTVQNTENTDWAAHRIEQSLTVTASVRKMGGQPTVEELLKIADEIRRGAELTAELQSMNICPRFDRP